MGVSLERSELDYKLIGNSLWCFLLNLGELYGWIPRGTIMPENDEFFQTWKGDYDSSDGQIFTAMDAISFADALNTAILDKEFELKSCSLKNGIKEAIERNIGRKLEYDFLSGNISIDFIKDMIDFLQKGEFVIN